MDIEQINKIYTDYLNDCESERDMEQIFTLAYKAISSAEPKTGHWVKTPNNKYMWYCDKCEYLVYQDSSRPYPSEKYCPNCGCRMLLPFA